MNTIEKTKDEACVNFIKEITNDNRINVSEKLNLIIYALSFDDEKKYNAIFKLYTK